MLSRDVTASGAVAKKKIALMSYAMDNRDAKGTALYTRKLIEHMLEDDRFDWYLVHFDRVDDPLYAKAHEILIPEIPHLPFGTRFVRTMLFFWKYRMERFDIIHWFQPRLYPFFWFAPSRHIVVSAHGGGDAAFPHPFIFSRFVFVNVLRYAGRFIDATIGDSLFAKEEIVEHYHLNRERVHSILLGGGENFKMLDKRTAQDIIQKKYQVSSPFILDVSRLQPHKNVDTLIRAYILLRDNFPKRKEQLVIAGSPVVCHEKTYALAGESKYAADIRFIEYIKQEDLNSMYSAAELFVFPSLSEGFGLPVIEAFVSGTPVITSNVTSLPEITGDAGITVDPRNVAALAGAMNSVLSDAKLREGLVRRGVARGKGFTWKRTALQTIKLYDDILRNRI